MLRATKIRIYPTQEQARFLNAQFGAVRFAYNKALFMNKRFYERTGVGLRPKKDLKPMLAVAKKSRKYSWLGDYDSIALQQALINLDKAFSNFFNPKLKAGRPKFKSKRGKQTSYHCTSVSAGDGVIKIPKCPPIKAKIHREITGKVKSITLSRTVTGKYYASVLVDDGVIAVEEIKTLDSNKVLGVDMGITHLAIDSVGNKTENPRFLKNAANNLRRKQKSLSRKVKGSGNRAKARLLVAKCHEKTAHARNDFQHKLSRQLIDDNQAITVETLKVKNMLKNRKLSKHIADASWSSLIEKLSYKAQESGKHLVKINQWYASSKTCSCCGHKIDDMPLKIRSWKCPSCLNVRDRDINAAINIKNQGVLKLKAAGLTVSACGSLR